MFSGGPCVCECFRARSAQIWSLKGEGIHIDFSALSSMLFHIFISVSVSVLSSLCIRTAAPISALDTTKGVDVSFRRYVLSGEP